MKIVSYIFEPVAIKNLVAHLSLLERRLPIETIVIIYNKKLTLHEVKCHFIFLDRAIKCIFYDYDGKNWEFGAYQLGIEKAVKQGDDLIIMNDTFGRHYPFFKSDLNRFVANIDIAKVSQIPQVVGKVEGKGIPFYLCGYEFDSWIRSNLFYLNAAALTCLKFRIFDGSVFHAPVVKDKNFSLGISASDRLQHYLESWMSCDPQNGGWLAHSGHKKVSDALRRDKTGSILLEKLVSARILSAEGKLLNYALDNSAFIYQARIRAFFRIRRIKRLLNMSLQQILKIKAEFV